MYFFQKTDGCGPLLSWESSAKQSTYYLVLLKCKSLHKFLIYNCSNMSANFQQINLHYYLQITTYNFFCLPDKILINSVAQ